jgi:hypothetical protein
MMGEYTGGSIWRPRAEPSHLGGKTEEGMVPLSTIRPFTNAPDFSQLQMMMFKAKLAQSLVVIVSHEPHKTIEPLLVWSRIVDLIKS